MSGCSDLARALDTPEQRINAAFPINGELKLSIDTVLANASGAQRSALTEQLNARLRLRAVNCAKGYMPGRFATAEQIRGRVTDKACFASADTELQRWAAILRVGQIAAAPPLIPITGNWAKNIEAPDFIVHAEFASSAAVVMFDSGVGYSVVDAMNGRLIRQGELRRASRKDVSPNGRLIASSTSDGASIHEAETGNLLLDWPSVRAGLTWIDSKTLLVRQVVLNNDRPDNLLIDLQSGEFTSLERYRLSPSSLIATARLDEYLDLSGETPRRLSFNRGAREITQSDSSTASNQERINWKNEPIAGTGKVIGFSDSSVHVFDIESSTRQRIDLHPLKIHNVLNGSTPSQPMLDVSLSTAPSPFRVVLDLSTSQLAKLITDRLPSPRLITSPNHSGLYAIQEKRLVAIDLLPTDAAVSVNQFTALAAQQANDARMQQFERRLAADQSPAASIGAPNNALLADLAKNAQIEGVGVYQPLVAGGRPAGGFGSQRLARPVNVRVRATEKPLVLVLSSYEPVHWMLQLEAGAKLSGVVLSGYHASEVFGAGKARTFQIGRLYAYNSSGPEYQRLNDELQRQMGRRIQSFQGRYEGSLFSVGG